MCMCIMGKTKYEMAISVLNSYKGKVLSINRMRHLIIQRLGGDERTINSYLMMMREMGLIKELEHMRFKILEEKE